jgi:hypothetical protein
MFRKDFMNANKLKPCEYCNIRNRANVGKLCGTCAAYLHRLGHPGARSPKLIDLKPFIEQTIELINLNPGHPGIDAWMKTSKAWRLQARSDPKSVPLGKWVARVMSDFDADVLKLGVGIHLYQCFHHKPTLLREPAATFGHLVRMICSYVPASDPKDPMHFSRVRAADLRSTRDFLRRNLGPLMQTFEAAVRARMAEDEKKAELMRVPLAHAAPDVEEEEVKHARNLTWLGLTEVQEGPRKQKALPETR